MNEHETTGNACHMVTAMPLYNALEPEKKHPLVFEKNFQQAQLLVALRPLSLPGDWPQMGNWFLDEFARGVMPVSRLPVNHLQETFRAMLQCNFAQPFLGLMNNHAGFLIEICEGRKQFAGFDEGPHVFEKGDHIIKLILSPPMLSMRTFAEYALLSSLEYFFSFGQVVRIVWELHEKDKHYINLAKRTGFIARQMPDWPGIYVFMYTRNEFSHYMDAYHP